MDAFASVGGLGISIISGPACDGLPTLPPGKDDGIGEEGAEWLGVELVGGLAEMRMLTSRESNIRRIRSVQFPFSNVGEAVGVVVDDGLLRSGD